MRFLLHDDIHLDYAIFTENHQDNSLSVKPLLFQIVLDGLRSSKYDSMISVELLSLSRG
jgi:hypothetical protein